jgi:hypothetical protein
LVKAFKLNWPELEDAIKKIPVSDDVKKNRSPEDLLEEVLSLVRSGFDDLKKTMNQTPDFDENSIISRAPAFLPANLIKNKPIGFLQNTG